MLRLRFPFAVGAAIAFLTLLTLRDSHGAGTKVEPTIDVARPVPVLVELFTSEGCSSCPPADGLLERLDRSQPVPGAELIVLSEHVDYWNDIGWKDPYSSHANSERQNAYAEHLGLRSVYTPQMVVDGRAEFVGSDSQLATRAIQNATKVDKISVSLTSPHFEGDNTITVHLETGALPAPVSAKSASVLLAIADESDESHVSRGENSGRILKHVAVLRNLVQVGSVDKTGEFSQDVVIDARNADSRNLRIVAIVQEKTAGKVWGVSSVRLSR